MTTPITTPSPEARPTGPLPAATPPVTASPAGLSSTATPPARPWPRRLTAHFWSRTGYLLGSLPTVVVAYSVGVSLFFFSLATAIIYIGLLSGALTLLLVHYVASFYKAWLRKCGYQFRVEPAPERPGQAGRAGQTATSPWLRRVLGIYAKPQRWRELAFLFVNFFLTLITWTIAVVWWVVGLSGLTYWFWSRLLPSELAVAFTGAYVPGKPICHPIKNGGMCIMPGRLVSWSELLHLPFLSADGFWLAAGLILLLLLLPLTQGLAWLHGALARGLLNPTRGELQHAQLAVRVRQVEASRAAATGAQTDDLRQIEQDLHDGPQQSLVRLGMDLASAQRRLSTGDITGADDLVGQARQRVDDTLAQIRQISRRTAPPILTEQGLPAALESLAATCPLPTIVDAPTGTSQADSQQRLVLDRLSPAAQTALYFAVGEALSNAAKHSGASRVVVRLRTAQAAAPGDADGPTGGRAVNGLTDSLATDSPMAANPAAADSVVCEVEDNGQGGAQILPGHGLAGLRDRLAGVDGSLWVRTVPGVGSLVRVSVPLAKD